jgi:hypothetical protein
MSKIELTTEQKNAFDAVNNSIGKKLACEHEDAIQELLTLIFGESAYIDYINETDENDNDLTVEVCLGHIQCAIENSDPKDAIDGTLSGGSDCEFSFTYEVGG